MGLSVPPKSHVQPFILNLSTHVMPKSRHPAHPRYWPSWFGMGLGWLIGILPYGLQMAIGRRLGDIAYAVVPKRREVARINLQMCFPENSVGQQEQLLRAHFRSVGMGAVETLICWWSSAAKVEQLCEIQGQENLTQAAASGQGIILLSAHFTSLELGVRMAKKPLRELGITTTAMYKPPHDPVIDMVMRARRERHIGEASIRQDQVKALIKALRNKRAVWYAADQRARENIGITVPFFGHQARTHVATSRLAHMGKAVVVPFFTLRKPNNTGYQLIILPALENFPSGDEAADALRINRLIEDMVRKAPAQYFWLHKRFQLTGFDPYTPASDAAR